VVVVVVAGEVAAGEATSENAGTSRWAAACVA